ncbi:MAG: iron-containing alcohol dehydrogenase [Alphaproteobacteria bacterium]|nr:iron-containing alcohol dehydrogenase [Alphaproteobacteria bacterium]
MTYELAPIARITGGIGARARLGDLATGLGGTGAAVLLVADRGLAATGLAAEVEGILRKAGHGVTVFSDFASDPTIAQTDAAAGLARATRAAVVVALGGGSALDLGKAVAAVATAPASALDYELCRQPFPATRLRTICAPTTAGTGSELTRTAVLTRADKAKIWLWGAELRADEVVLDPELTVGLPPALTAATGIDALVHAAEAATNANATAANNVYAHEAIRLVARHLEAAVADGRDLVARDAVQRAAALAGVAIDNAGTAIAHNIGHALASIRSVHHGRAVGLAMLATNAWNAADDDGRWAACAAALGARDFASGFERLLRAVGVKVGLAAEFAGVAPDALLAKMLAPENAPMRRSNRRASTEADLRRFAETMLTQS